MATIRVTEKCAKESGMRAVDRRLAQLRSSIPLVVPRDAFDMCNQGAIILDVRDSTEIDQGIPKGALHIQRGFLELTIESDVPDFQQKILLICAAGPRSLFAADDLLRLGYRNVACIDGGFKRWRHEGLPFEIPMTN